mgnify:CR=1 FL=1
MPNSKYCKHFLSLEEAQEYFIYNPDTGHMYWRKSPGGRPVVGDIVGYICDGYRSVGFKGITHKVHRLAWLLSYGVYPVEFIDHINHTNDDNRLINLREAEYIDNNRNAVIRIDNTTGYQGITWRKDNKKWCVRIGGGSKGRIYIGQFTDKQDAIAAREEAQLEYGYHANHGK